MKEHTDFEILLIPIGLWSLIWIYKFLNKKKMIQCWEVEPYSYE